MLCRLSSRIALRPHLTVGGDHAPEIAGHRRVVRVDRMADAGVPVPIVPGADAHLLVELVRRHERRVDLDGHRLRQLLAGSLPHLDRGASGGHVRDHGMARIRLVLDQHLPVAVVQIAHHAAGDFQPAGRRAIDHVVDTGKRVTEETVEIRPLLGEAGKHEATIVANGRNGGEPCTRLALRKAGVFVAARQRQGGGAAIQAEAPPMIRAAKDLARVAAGFGGDPRALMRAAVV